MSQLDGRTLLEQSERTGHVYRLTPGWRKYHVFTGVVLCLLVLTIPLAIMYFRMARRARVGLTAEGFAIQWFGIKAFRWTDVEEFRTTPWRATGGLTGVAIAAAVTGGQEMKGALRIRVRGRWVAILAHQFAHSGHMARAMERHTGQRILTA